MVIMSNRNRIFGICGVGNYVYLADRNRGLEVIDVSDPTNPHEIGFFNRLVSANGVAVADGYAFRGRRLGHYRVELNNLEFTLSICAVWIYHLDCILSGCKHQIIRL